MTLTDSKKILANAIKRSRANLITFDLDKTTGEKKEQKKDYILIQENKKNRWKSRL